MKFVGIVLCAVMIALSARSSSAQENHVRAQRPDHDLRSELKNIITNLPKDLSSEGQRAEFASVINLLMAKRIAKNVMGYEQSPAFQQEFAKTYVKFLESLKSSSGPINAKDIEEFVKTSADAYDKNHERFKSFYDELVRPDPQLKVLTLEDTLRKLVQFSAWLYINDRQRWLLIFRISFVWPLCVHQPK